MVPENSNLLNDQWRFIQHQVRYVNENGQNSENLYFLVSIKPEFGLAKNDFQCFQSRKMDEKTGYEIYCVPVYSGGIGEKMLLIHPFERFERG